MAKFHYPSKSSITNEPAPAHLLLPARDLVFQKIVKMLLMKDDLFALCEKRGRKVNELADLLAKQLGRHPRSPEILEELEQLLDNWADVTLRKSQPRTELQRLLAQCQELGERILDLEEKHNGSSD